MILKETQTLEQKVNGSILTYIIDLDADVKPEHIKAIMEVFKRYDIPHVNSMSISEGFDYTLIFKCYDDMFHYLDTHNLQDADHFVLNSGYSVDVLNFTFRLRTNHMNVTFRRHEPDEVLRIVSSIEQALLSNDNV